MKIDHLPSMPGIYCIHNLSTNRKYVGSSHNIYGRIVSHLSLLSRGIHPNPKLLAHFKKYGRTSFNASVLELVDESEKLIEREQYWMDELDVCSVNGLNILPNAASTIGYKWSEEQKHSRSSAYAGSNNPFYGKTHSPESIRRTVAANKLRVGKLNSFFQKKHSPEAKQKISEAASNRTIEHRMKLSKAASKTYIITYPSGEQETVCNLRQWCLSNKLKYDYFKDILRGKKRTANGWSITKIDSI